MLDRLTDGKLACIIAVGSMALALYQGIRTKKIADTLDLTVEELTTKTHVEVADAVVEAAVQRAVDREVREITRIAQRRLSEEIKEQVRGAINKSYSELKDSVSDEIAKQVKNVDMAEIERDSVRKAKEAIAEKFDTKLDGLLSDFNDNLTNISKIYASIAKTMSEK